ncbi:MAG: hypothetical protein IPL39_20190 [Opitutaceae bacterium]|nr:hypothetical protein [Opitutaceae bacterium]
MSITKLLHATRWINLLERDGWVFASRRRPEEPNRIDAVTIVALHHAEPAEVLHRLVVIEEFRVPLQQWEYSLPAGLLDPGESITDCGTRELQGGDRPREHKNPSQFRPDVLVRGLVG